jgi:ubiquinone/menaquinone biosynthesis C-methylase UbiE
MKTVAVYDKIGKTYDQTRKPDPEITQKIIKHLSAVSDGKYLDIGCGSGNYTHAIFENGFHICGVDISEEMLGKARRKNSKIEWTLGDAKQLPFTNNQFDGATCTLATHHIKDIEKSFQEAFRVLKNGNFVIFTSFPEQMTAYWLNQYFPNMMNTATNLMHSPDRIFTALEMAGFKDIRTEKFFVSNVLQDWFLHAGKYRPHIYLDPVVRSGISTFALENNHNEVMRGCEKLYEDITSGEINKIIEIHENNLGDYVFVTCTKR